VVDVGKRALAALLVAGALGTSARAEMLYTPRERYHVVVEEWRSHHQGGRHELGIHVGDKELVVPVVLRIDACDISDAEIRKVADELTRAIRPPPGRSERNGRDALVVTLSGPPGGDLQAVHIVRLEELSKLARFTRGRTRARLSGPAASDPVLARVFQRSRLDWARLEARERARPR
jgi:hypothetical protein